MLIITIRSDNPEAEIGLFDGPKKLAYQTWHAHRELSATIHQKIEAVLEAAHKDWSDLQGIVCFQGPGSFTGLRIGLSVGNALAYSLHIPIVAVQGGDWIQRGVDRLQKGDADPLALPHYGTPPHITMPRK